MQEWISISEAREKIINYSDKKLMELIDTDKIIGTKGKGKGAKRMINVASLRAHLECLSQPMGS
jgi:hypothetical protein